MTRIQQDIEEYRKGHAVLHLKTTDDQPLNGAYVSVQQIEHGFLFGCYLDMFDRFSTPRENEKYKQYFSRLFNYATINLYEREHTHTDKIASWCQENGIKVMAQPLVAPTQFISDRPDSIKKLIETTVACYRGNIDQWEVVSELVDRDLIKPCFQWARQMQPEATLILNGCIATTGKQQFCNLLREIEIVNDVPIDAIGLDICDPLGTHVAPAKLLRVLNQYAEFGLPIRMTQPMLPSDGRPIRSSWKQGAWTEREQANYAAALYTVCFSHPSVEAITWSIFADKADSQEECGLLRTKLYTKRIYKILRKLIHSEWRTRVHGSPNENGDFHFRGFYGQYQVTVIPGNRTPYTTTIHLSKNGRSDFDITLA